MAAKTAAVVLALDSITQVRNWHRHPSQSIILRNEVDAKGSECECWTPQDEGRQLEHSSRIGAGRYDRFRKPPANDRYLRTADGKSWARAAGTGDGGCVVGVLDQADDVFAALIGRRQRRVDDDNDRDVALEDAGIGPDRDAGAVVQIAVLADVGVGTIATDGAVPAKAVA